jgi:hypothetical protein
VPGRPGGQPAADGGALEGLGEEPEAQPLVAQGRLQLRPGRPGQHPGGPADRVDLGHPGQSAQIQGDHADKAVPHGRFHAADHTGPAAEGDHRHLAWPHQSSVAATSASARGRRTGSGGWSMRPRTPLIRSQ